MTTGTFLNKYDVNRFRWAIINDTTLLYNVVDYGAVGDGVTDDYVAILAAFTAALANPLGGRVYFPPGTYNYGTALNLNAGAIPISVEGSGAAATTLAPTFASGNAFMFTGNGTTRFTISNITFRPNIIRLMGTFNLYVKDCARVLVKNVVQDSSNGGLFMFEGCVFLDMSGCQGDSTNGTTSGDTCLRIKGGTTGHVSNCYFRSSVGVTGYTNCKPCLYLTGTVTSLGFENCIFAGAGPRSQYAVVNIDSTGVNFTVTTSVAHDFRVGDFIVLRGNLPGTYNSMFRVATVPTSTVLTVTSTLNPGHAVVIGTAESVSTAAFISNEDAGGAAKSVNEGRFSSCLFEATQAGLYGSAAIYFDGRRGSNGTQAGSISGWVLSGNYYDQYHIGILISGKAANTANESTVNGFSIEGGVFNARGRAVHLDQVQGISASNLICCVPGAITPIADGISASVGLYIYSGPAAPYSQGINISNSQFGMGRNWIVTNNNPYAYGVLLDSPGINDLIFQGNNVFGATAGIGEANSPLGAGAQRWKIDKNIIASGTFPPTNATSMPSVASAATINFTNIYQDVVKITGNTDIQTINSQWHGRKISLIFTAALNLITGGNLAVGANYAVLIGQTVTLIYDAATATWYLK